MHEQQAKAQNVSIDEIIKRETLLGEGQTAVDYKDEMIDGERATLQYKSSYGSWATMPFVKEDGVWKIDKQGYADQLMKDFENSDKRIDDVINSDKTPTTNFPGEIFWRRSSHSSFAAVRKKPSK